jgi:hypothetical protein
MNRPIACLHVLAALVLTSGALAQQRVTSIHVEVLDADTAEPIKASVIVNGTAADSGYVVPSDSDSSIELDIRADAGAEYYPRTLTVFLEAIKQKQVFYRIYLAPIDHDSLHNRADVARTIGLLNAKDADRALALLEAINTEASPPLQASQFGVYLKYNLWRAYFINCTQRFVAYCDQAISAQQDLLQMQKSDPSYFVAEHVSTKDFERSARDISDNKFKLLYLSAIWDLNRHQPKDALDSLTQLDEAAKADQDLLGRLSISQNEFNFSLTKAKRASEQK